MHDMEKARLAQADEAGIHWRKWGPYLSERQWGTVREDYSQSGDAWNYMSHDEARSRAYRWGEDGLAGISDDKQLLCFALALWNGKDPVLKERAFGLTNNEGNHGEDVKEYYFYLDNTPTHSYMKYLYKYPQGAFPYTDLVETNRKRNRNDFEYELLDTGIFDDNRYFDVFVEYAKATPEDILVEITIENRGPEEAALHVLPTLWFRNTWAPPLEPLTEMPELRPVAEGSGLSVIAARHPELGLRYLHAKQGEVLFCDNETNRFKYPDARPSSDYYKDGINEYIVHGNRLALSPRRTGTKASISYALTVPAGGSTKLRLRLCQTPPDPHPASANGRGLLGADFERIFDERRQEADEFYAGITPASLVADERRVYRQALSGMLWGKQFYSYDVAAWIRQHGGDPLGAHNGVSRNGDWQHMVQADVVSMPDKWEYPWYAAWDLAFHVLPLSLVDPAFGKGQLELLLRERYLHPNGQLPAYEWNFGDVNPPVHAWAAYFLYQQDQAQHGGPPDTEFLRRCYNKLLLNFTWWVNRKDPSGRNVFEGGFLGLDNIGVFDRSAPLPLGGRMEQADGTAWMAFFSQSMLQISLELTHADPTYGDMALKFFEHFLWIASAMGRIGDGGMWDEEDGFFYDVVRAPDGRARRVKVRSMVGLLPLCATTALEEGIASNLPELPQRARWFVERRPELVSNIHDPRRPGVNGRRLLAIVDESKLRRILARMLDENEFLSPYGIRSLSRYHHDHPYSVQLAGMDLGVGYLPAESDSGMFGGNSNWRGPVWMPMNALLVRALLHFYFYYGDDFRVECPTGSGHFMTLYEVANDLTQRLTRLFLKDDQGHRPVYGGTQKFVDDPHWKDHLLFFEYFHGDNGAGLGASHQTGWTGLIASLMHLFATQSAESMLRPRVHRQRKVDERREAPMQAERHTG
jgi:hypothetical protein